MKTAAKIVLGFTFILTALACCAPVFASEAFRVPNPVQLKEKLTRAEVQGLVVDDLATHLDGGDSGINWNIHSTTAVALKKDFDKNEVAAMKKYNWPGIVVEGRVSSIDIVINTPTVKLASGQAYLPVNLFVSAGNDKWLEGLEKNSTVRMGCKNVRSVLKTVALYECVPLPKYVQERAWAYVDSIPSLAAKGDEMARFLQRKLK